MAKADLNYRADRERSINVFGEFGDELLARVLPRIAELRAQNSKPITVYIHSRGGLVRCLDVIQGAITSKDADGNSCRMITVALGDCGSAAASLFALGGYAIAYPHSAFHFHGIRLSEVEVTMEDATSIAQYLAAKNREIAFRLAQSMISRLIHRYLLLVDEISEHRSKLPNTSFAGLVSFVSCIRSRTSLPADRILESTLNHVSKVVSLSSTVFKGIRLTPGDPGVRHDTRVFRAVLNYELRLNRNTDWRLDEAGLAKVYGDYFLLRDFYIGEHDRLVESIIESYGYHFLSADESLSLKEKQDTDPKAAKTFLNEAAWQMVKLFWYFTVVLSRLLQQDENRLRSDDAYWLGAADEIMGTDMSGERMIMEEDVITPPEPT